MSFQTVYMDPPWPERGGGKIKRGADRHYKVQTVHDIPRIIQLAPCWDPAKNAHCYMWTTSNYLMAGGRVMSDIGFRYVACVPWDKKIAGLGQYWRTRYEYLLFGVRGRGFAVKTEPRDIVGRINEVSIDELAEALHPVGIDEKRSPIHSRKPEGAVKLIEARSKGPFLEMFAREQRAGWESWGNAIAA